LKKILILCLFISAFIYGHEQHVHQYLTKEAYYLLRDYLNNDIPVMLNHLDNGPVGPPWTNGTLLAGAWREDEEDIVYGLYQFMPGDPYGALTSITHFWDADDGDFNENTFQVAWSFFTGSIGPYPNSYSKINKFAFGGYILYFNVLPYLRVQKSNGEWLRLIPGTPYNIALSYYSLKDLYLNRRLVTQLVGSYKMYNENKSAYEYYYGDVYVSEDFRDKLVWEILGRMCHLLQDLSIPAHTHRDEHGLPPSDQYEDWVAYNGRYNYYSHLNIGTGILDPYISSNPLHYLMYTTQQIGDHFGSSGPYEGVGNDFVGGNSLPEEIVFFNSTTLTNLGAPTYLSGSYSDIELNNIRDKTIPHVIKATAGLLYWFAKETNMLPPPPLSATISGPSTAPCATGTWSANVSGGYPPYTYQWYQMYASGGGLESSLQKGTIAIQPYKQIDTWYPVGNNTSTLNYYLCGGNSYIRVDVKDSHNTLKSVQQYVAGANGGGGGVLPKAEANNSAALSKADLKIPKEYNIEQNYPNPFNPTTIISYSIKTEGRASLKIYNTLGEEVRTLVDEIKQAGNYEVEFNASELPSGIYIYRMQSGDYLSIKKMLLVK